MKLIKVTEDDDSIRLDKWFKRNMPEVPYGLVQRLIRKGAIKIDGKKAKADAKVQAGQEIRIPEIEQREPTKRQPEKIVISDKQVYQALVDNIIFENKNIIAFNKPPGLATQGGTKVNLSVDGMLGVLSDIFGKEERYKLVHRLDKDTSGVIIIARNNQAASKATEDFRLKNFNKTYWALVMGVPNIKEGTIDLPLATMIGAGNAEKMCVDEEEGKKSITHYKVIETASHQLSWLEINTETGRKHQIRAHLNAIGHPIIGDGKYGGAEAFIDGISNKMHLHSRNLQHDSFMGTALDITAPLPQHMKTSWKMFEFDCG